MPQPPRHLASLTIPNGMTESPVIDLRAAPYQYLTGLLIVAPTTLPETITVHAAAAAAGPFQPLQSDGTDVTIPAAKATPLYPIHMIGALKLVAGAGVGVDRVFTISGGQGHPGA